MDKTAKETVIIVHGTFAAPRQGVSQWYQPAEGMPATEGFIAKLNDALQKRGSAAQCWAHCRQGDQGFHWSGKNHWIDRTRAAAELGSYVLNLRKQDWCCHIVAHSHGGNVVLEALPQITAALNKCPSLGKIVTLGTPFIDTISPILQKRARTQRVLTELSAMTAGLCFGLFVLYRLYRLTNLFDSTFFNRLYIGLGLRNFFDSTFFLLCIVIIFLGAAIVFALRFFSRKIQDAKPILNRAAQMQLKFLAIGSLKDEAWQLLHHMRTYSNPMAVKTNLIRYLISSMQSHISLTRQIARIYERKSYRDLNLRAKLDFALMHLLLLLLLLWCCVLFKDISFTGPFATHNAGPFATHNAGPFATDKYVLNLSGVGYKPMAPPGQFTIPIWLGIFGVGWTAVLLVLTGVHGTAFFSAFLSPFRWCAYRFGAVIGIFREIVTYVVRRRGWSVVQAIAMGLQGYPYSLPRIEQYPSSVPGNFITYENMPTGAEQHALAMRGDWINRHLNNVAQTFAKLAITSADIALLQHTIEADLSLVHAAYYTDDECIARIADWIATKDDQARLTE